MVTLPHVVFDSATVDEFGAVHDVVACTRRELDVTDHAGVLRVVAQVRPSAVINCAAYNHVDEAEDNAAAALAHNAFAVRSLARASAEHHAVLVHYGSDFVFDGTATRPYTEEDRPHPRSVYALSKLLGEWFASDTPRHYVLRVESLFGGPAAKSSVDRIIDALAEGREARVFVDRTVSPSYVVDVARATRQLLERDAPTGLYHCVNSGMATWYELGQEVARAMGRPPRLVPVGVADVRLRAPRPQFCALSNAKLAAADVVMPPWQDAIARYIALRRLRSLAAR
jgi:dTDP-4-dehydrorhamnose reductase